MEASVQNDAVEADGSVVVVGLVDQLEGQGLVWVGISVRWQVEGQTPPPWVHAGASLGVRWQAEEGREGEGHLEDPVGVGKGLVGDVRTDRVEGDGCSVREGGWGRVVPGPEEVSDP